MRDRLVEAHNGEFSIESSLWDGIDRQSPTAADVILDSIRIVIVKDNCLS
jgi:hypothetical protein